MRTDVRRALRTLALHELGWDGELPEGALTDHFDSLELMTLVVAVEDRFQVVLEPDDEEAIETIDDLVATIERKRHA